MTKKQKVEQLMKTLAAQGYSWEVLSKSKSGPNHIRVKGFGDIWPSTGTYRVGSTWVKKDHARLIATLGGSQDVQKTEGVQSNRERIASLEKEVGKLKIQMASLMENNRLQNLSNQPY